MYSSYGGFWVTLEASTQAENQVKGGLLLDVVVAQSTTILQLLASEDQTLLVGMGSFLVLELLFHVLYRVSRVDFQGDSPSGQGFDEDLHASTQAENQVKSRLLLDVVVAQSTTVFQLLASKDNENIVPTVVGGASRVRRCCMVSVADWLAIVTEPQWMGLVVQTEEIKVGVTTGDVTVLLRRVFLYTKLQLFTYKKRHY